MLSCMQSPVDSGPTVRTRVGASHGRRLMPRYLIHPLLYHRVHMHSTIMQNALVCQGKDLALHTSKRIRAQINEKVNKQGRLWGIKYKNRHDILILFQLLPELQLPISWQIFLPDNWVIKDDSQVHLHWGRKCDSPDCDWLTDAAPVLHQVCTVELHLKFQPMETHNSAWFTPPSLHSEATSTVKYVRRLERA